MLPVHKQVNHIEVTEESPVRLQHQSVLHQQQLESLDFILRRLLSYFDRNEYHDLKYLFGIASRLFDQHSRFLSSMDLVKSARSYLQ